MTPEENTQHPHEKAKTLECLGMISGNCIMVDCLRESIKYPSRTRALLQKGPASVNVFTWPGTQAGHLAEPLSGALMKLLTGPVGTVSTELSAFLNFKTHSQNFPGPSYPTIVMDATLVASPTPTPTLTIIIMLFSPAEQSAEVLQIFEEKNLKIEMVEGYHPEKCWGIPHSSYLNVGQRSTSTILIHGCKTPLLPHQQRALDFIQKLESPESTTLSTFWNSSICGWLKQSFEHLVDTGRTQQHINHHNQGSILADDMGLGKTLTSLALIVTSKTVAESFANTHERNTKATLVICPLSTLANWEAEIHKHLELSLIRYVVYHGDKRKQWTAETLSAIDVVLVTYDTIANHYETKSDALFELTWFRTILDEAHLIRDLTTKRSRAILALQTQRKLCLTGTPLQNHLSDLYTLLRFVKADPWMRPEIWQTYITPNIRRKSAKAIDMLQQLLATVSLRRLKTNVLELPPKVEEHVGLQMLDPWREDYQKRYHDFAIRFGVDRDGGSWDSTEFFQELTKLRLYCDHPGLVDDSQYDVPKTELIWRDSPKIMHLIADLKVHLSSQLNGQIAKAVVFSQWTSFLAIVGAALDDEGIAFEQLDGSSSLQQRERCLAKIRQQPNLRVIVATIGAGGVGIDLTCTQKVYLMEPCWNPSVESQAIDRAYRLGQLCTTHVIHYYMEGSIEVNMMEVRCEHLQRGDIK